MNRSTTLCALIVVCICMATVACGTGAGDGATPHADPFIPRPFVAQPNQTIAKNLPWSGLTQAEACGLFGPGFLSHVYSNNVTVVTERHDDYDKIEVWRETKAGVAQQKVGIFYLKHYLQP